MRRYYIKVVGGEIVERRMYDTVTPPTGLTEVTKAQYDGIHDPTYKYTYSGGSITPAGNRPFRWNGVPDNLGPNLSREEAYIDP